MSSLEYKISLESVTITEDIASAAIGQKRIVFNGTLKVTNLEWRDLNYVPQVFGAYLPPDGGTRGSIDFSACPTYSGHRRNTWFRAADSGTADTDPAWCVFIANTPEIGTAIPMAVTKVFELSEANTGDIGDDGIPDSSVIAENVSVIAACIEVQGETRENGVIHRDLLCVLPDGTQFRLDDDV